MGVPLPPHVVEWLKESKELQRSQAWQMRRMLATNERMHHAYGELLQWVCHAVANCQDLEHDSGYYANYPKEVTESNTGGSKRSSALGSEGNIQEFCIADDDEELMFKWDEVQKEGTSIDELFGEWRLAPALPVLNLPSGTAEPMSNRAVEKTNVQHSTGLLDVLGDLRTKGVSQKAPDKVPMRRPNKPQCPSPQPSQGKSGKTKDLQNKAAPRGKNAGSASVAAVPKTPLVPQNPAEAHGVRLAYDAVKLLQASVHEEPQAQSCNMQTPNHDEPKKPKVQRSWSASPRLTGSRSPSLPSFGRRASNFYAAPVAPQLPSTPKLRTPLHANATISSNAKSTARGNSKNAMSANLSSFTQQRSTSSSLPMHETPERSASASPKPRGDSRNADRLGVVTHTRSDSICKQSNCNMSDAVHNRGTSISTPIGSPIVSQCSNMHAEPLQDYHGQRQDLRCSANLGGQAQSLQPASHSTLIPAPQVATLSSQVTRCSVLVPSVVDRRQPVVSIPPLPLGTTIERGHAGQHERRPALPFPPHRHLDVQIGCV
jgi:hypothetical protein